MAGAGPQEIVQAALRTLKENSKADRVGVWLESAESDSRRSEPVTFRGLVWDRENPDTPHEWQRLAPQLPLPAETISGEKSVIVELQQVRGQSVIGPLVGMQRALWVPVGSKGVLSGLLLVANRDRARKLSLAPCEAVAAELALALVYCEEQSRTRQLHRDLLQVRQTLSAGGTHGSGAALLATLAEECTLAGSGSAHGLAEFVLIGRLSSDRENLDDEYRVAFHWTSGDATWLTAMQGEPFYSMWRTALQTRQTAGMDPEISWCRGTVRHVMAIPLEAHGELAGIWIAGLRQNNGPDSALERIHLRSQLAAMTLAEMNHSERDLRAEEWRQSLLNAGSEALLLLNMRDRIAGATTAACQLLGLARQTSGIRTTAEEFANSFRIPDRERVKSWTRHSRNSLAPSGQKQERIEVVLENGTAVRVFAAQHFNGQFIALRCEVLEPVHETTESLRAERELQAVLSWLEEGVVVFDAQENIRVLNNRFAQIAGLHSGEAADLSTLEALIHRFAPQASDPQQFARNWRHVAAGDSHGVREELEISLPLPCTLERNSRPILNAGGLRIGCVEIYRDLTARRLYQSKLLQTEKLAAVGQKISGVVHELSNPLTTILGYAQRLLAREQASGNAGEARQIFNEAERAGKILRQLLPASRETSLQRSRVSLNRMVLQTIEMQRLYDGSEAIRMELDLDPLSPVVWGDVGQLQQVLINLVSNARQAILESGKTGVIRVRTRMLPASFVLLEVEDNGPGIPEAIAARIFDPFFTTKHPDLGTGLGLSIVLSVVREHGGQLHVSSPRTGGTKFSIELRAMCAASPEPKPQSPADPRSSASFWVKHGTKTETPRQKEHGVRAYVLVVEDEPTVARLIADVLEDEGYKVDIVRSGREAQERVGGAEYDLVICDMKMPGLDGQHFFQALVRTQNPLREKLLFVTGDGVAPRTRAFLERNQLPFVAKPFRVEELSQAVRKILAAKSAMSEEKKSATRKLGANNA